MREQRNELSAPPRIRAGRRRRVCGDALAEREIAQRAGHSRSLNAFAPRLVSDRSRRV
jgi:hypothetical protein